MDIKKKKITSSKVNSVGAPLSPEEEIAWLVSFSKGRGSGSEREKEDTTKQIIKYKAVRNESARAHTRTTYTHTRGTVEPLSYKSVSTILRERDTLRRQDLSVRVYKLKT